MRVFDLHCDTLDRLSLDGYPDYSVFTEQNAKEGIPHERLVSLRDNDAHIALDRMSAQAWCQCFAIFVPDSLPSEGAWRLYKQVHAYFSEQMQAHADVVEQVSSSRSHGIDEVLATGKCAALLTVEGASFLEDSCERIDELAQAGVRMVTLTWNAQNALAGGSNTHAGISALGRAAISAFEQHHITIDASHISDESFQDLLTCAKRPFVASHSNARSVCAHPRNLTDFQFQAIAERGGLVGLNFCNGFLVEGTREPRPSDLLRHIEHWLELGGQDVIALGSDYDGTDVPSWLNGCEQLQNLYEPAAARFGNGIADKLFFENAYAFFQNS